MQIKYNNSTEQSTVQTVFTDTEGKRFLYNTREGITDHRLQRYHDMTNSAHELTTSVIEGNQAE